MTVIEVRAGEASRSDAIARVVDELRAAADSFAFLAGGASKMPPEAKGHLLALLEALPRLATRGVRVAVGDGATKAGIIEAAGAARARSGAVFPLLGVAPAREILPVGAPGRTPIEPNHTHVVAVEDPTWPERRRAAGGWKPTDGYWGSEIETMYEVFGRLSEGRPSVTVVANGGTLTLDEVRHNVAQRRRIVVVEGSGRAADAIVAHLRGRGAAGADAELYAAASSCGVATHAALFEVFPLVNGPEALASLLQSRLGS